MIDTIGWKPKDRIVIDLETRSGYDIKKVGVHKYTESPDFAILLVAYKINDEPSKVLDIVNDQADLSVFENMLISLMLQETTNLVAFNVDFELACFSRYDSGFLKSKPRWTDVQTYALMLGLPGSLAKVLRVLKMTGKDTAGTTLINKFSVPKGKGFKVHYTQMTPALKADWQNFIKYAQNDVDREHELLYKLEDYMASWPVTEFERRVDCLSNEINYRGVRIDLGFTQWLNTVYNSILLQQQIELAQVTGLANPNSPVQFSKWLHDNKIFVTSTRKDELKAVETDNPTVQRALELKADIGSTIPKKYEAGINHAMKDHRMRGLFKYYGASRTGRWSSSGYQLHNLARTDDKIAKFLHSIFRLRVPFDEQIALIKDEAEAQGKPLAQFIGQCVRSIIIPRHGCEFIIADFSAIEARVAAWLAGEEWVLEVFRTDGLIYERTASRMYNVSVEDAHQPEIRRKGKYAVLALGYGGGIQALKNFGADKVMDEDEMDNLVTSWRAANPNIVLFWSRLEAGFRGAFDNPNQIYRVNEYVAFHYDTNADIMHMVLPSGRTLAYYKPRVSRREIKYLSTISGHAGVNDTTYGGKLMENLCQAVARDFLANFLLNLESNELEVLLHVHDEAVIEVEKDTVPVSVVEEIGSLNPEWGQGIPLAVSVERSNFYTK